MTKLEKDTDVHVNQASDSSAGISIAIAAAILIIGALFFFNGSFDMTPNNPQVVQNNTTLPAPVIEAPVAPEVTTPPVTPPAAPSADAPAANP